MTIVLTLFGSVITALLGGMFLFMVSAIDDVRAELRSEIGSVRSEVSSLRDDMNAQIGRLVGEIGSLRTDMDRKFDHVNAVLLDHTDRLARIETALGISGRPVGSETDALTEP